jgi:hypothetical protein
VDRIATGSDADGAAAVSEAFAWARRLQDSYILQVAAQCFGRARRVQD